MFGTDPDSADSAWMLPDIGTTTTITGGAQRLPLLPADVETGTFNADPDADDTVLDEIVEVDADFKGVNGVRFTA